MTPERLAELEALCQPMSARDEAREAAWAAWKERHGDIERWARTHFMAGADWQAEQALTIEREALNKALLDAAEARINRLKVALEACIEALEGLPPCDIDTPPVGGQAFVCRTHHQLAPCDEGMQWDAAIAQARAALGQEAAG